MAGRLTVSTLNNDTGVLATQNGMTGIAKAWLRYDGSTQTINNSFNISSVTYNGAGIYTINFTTAMANANYSVSGTGGLWNTTNSWIQVNPASFATSSFQLANVSGAGAVQTTCLQISVFGS